MRKIFCFLVILCIVSCSLSPKPQGLERAESLVDSFPDSAMEILSTIQGEANHYSERYRMEYNLLWAETMNKLYLPMDTIKFMPEVLRYYDRHGSNRDLTMANYLMGCVYRDKGDSPMALNYLLEAASCADTIGREADLKLLSRIYGQIGFLFYKQRLPQKAISAWKTSGRYALIAADTLTAIQSMEFAGHAYSLMGVKDSTILMAEKVYREYKIIGREDYAAASLSTLIEHCIENGELDKGRKLIAEYIIHSGLANAQGEIKPGHEMFYHIWGKFYEKERKPDSAAYYYRKLIARSSGPNSLESGYRGLLNVYSAKGVADSVAKYANLFADTNDSLSLSLSTADVTRAQALYDYGEYQRIANEKSLANSRLYLVLACVLIMIIISSLALYLLIKRQKAKRQRRMQALRDKYSATLNLYHQALIDMKMMKLGFEKAKKAKTEEIMKLQQALSTYTEYSNVEDWNAEQSLVTNDMVVRLHDHAQKGLKATSSEWADLLHLVNELAPKFYHYITDEKLGLTEREVLVCILTRFHFLPSEIGNLLGLKKQSVSNLRANLNEKIFKTSGTKSFNANILRI